MALIKFELANFQPSYFCSGQKRKKQEKRLNTREKKVWVEANKMIWKKNANSLSDMRKIDEKITQRLGRHTSHSLMQLPAKSSLLSQSFAHKINDTIH